jgi:hypothetical protein
MLFHVRIECPTETGRVQDWLPEFAAVAAHHLPECTRPATNAWFADLVSVISDAVISAEKHAERVRMNSRVFATDHLSRDFITRDEEIADRVSRETRVRERPAPESAVITNTSACAGFSTGDGSDKRRMVMRFCGRNQMQQQALHPKE